MANIVKEEVTIPSTLHNLFIRRRKLLQSIKDDYGCVSIKFPPPNKRYDKIIIRGSAEDVAKATHQLLELAAEKQQSSYSLEVCARPELHKFLIGKSGSRINKIREGTSTRIIFPNEGDDDKEVITIIGKKEDAEKAKEELENIIQQIENKYEDEVHVAPKYHKHFVSRKGEILQNIVFECGGFDHVSISFPRADIKDSRVVLKGVKESVQLAKTKILDIVKDLEEQITIEVVIPNEDHRSSLLRSRTYPTVDNIQRAHSVKITFPPRVNDSYHQISKRKNNYACGEGKEQPKPYNILHITGKPENCEVAKKLLLKMVIITVMLDIPHKYHRSIIGQNGVFIHKIISNYDVLVDVPPIYMKLDIIKIHGRPVSVENAKNVILKVARREEKKLRNFEQKVYVPLEFHSQILGRAGEVINKIRTKYDVQISLPKKNEPDNTILVITGCQPNVEAAKTKITNIVQRLVSDRPAFVENAENAILKKKKEIEARPEEKKLRSFEQKFHVPLKYHRQIIGPAGNVINKIRSEYHVQIFLLKNHEQDNTIITGYQHNVEAAKTEIMNIVQRLKSRYKETVNIDRRVHSQMIGAKGRHVRRIMDKYEVEILFPRKNDCSADVVIMGDEEKVLNCKDYLFSLEQDFLLEYQNEKPAYIARVEDKPIRVTNPEDARFCKIKKKEKMNLWRSSSLPAQECTKDRKQSNKVDDVDDYEYEDC